MEHGFAAFWDGAVAPYICAARPHSVLILGGGDGSLAGAILDICAPWDGVVHVAERSPAFDPATLRQPDGSRFTLHRADAKDAAGLLPVPALVLFDGASTWRGVTGALYALQSQSVRTGKPFPVVLAAGVNGAGARRDADAVAGEVSDPRGGILTALEDFVTAQEADLSLAMLPLLGGLAVIAPWDAGADVAALLGAIAIGDAARTAAARASEAAASLAEEAASLRHKLAAADHRNERLHAALRLAQARPDHAADQSAADAAPRAGVRNSVKSLLRAAGLRPGSQAAPDPREEAEIARLRASPVFDDGWYQARYGDVAASGVDAAAHYYRFGAAEGRDPGPDFVTAFYLAAAPDVARAGINPVLHYLASGASEGRDPGPDFSTRFYLEANPDVAAAGVNPLEHYLTQGRREGRQGLPPH